MSRSLRSLLVALAAATAFTPVGAQQGTGSIAGRVIDAEQQRPVPEAQVVVVGTTQGARTDADGRYRIAGVRPGTVTMRVIRIGYQSTTRGVVVTSGQETSTDFTISAAPTILSTVTTTAAGTEQTRRENGASVSTINADTIVKAAVQNFSQLVTGRTPGVTIAQSTGTTGLGARVRIRGSNSMSLSNEPLLIIDGIRIDNTAESNSIDVGGQSPSRLNDINPEDIESLEIIKGPAAAALYGTAAANGVIQVTTKRGRVGKPEWNLYTELGTVNENNDYPANYGGWTNTPLYGFPGWPSSKPNMTCNLVDEFYGNCQIDSLSAFNVIESSKPFRTGHRQKVGGNLSGGTTLATYFLSGDVEKEGGIYKPNNLNRLNLRGNIRAHPTEKLDLLVSTGFVRSDLQLPQNDNNYYGVLSNGIAGWPGPGPTQGYNPIPPSQFEQIETRQGINRFTGGVNGTWRPLSWLSGNATMGMDVLNRLDEETVPPNTVFFGDADLGQRQSNRIQVLNVTSNYSLTARYGLPRGLSAMSQAGFQYQQAQSRGTFASGKTLTSGTGSLGGVNSDKSVDESTVENKTVGGFLSQQLSWNEKLYLTGTVRGDKNSAFGKKFGFIMYPSVSASYVVSEGGQRLSQLRLRAAYGESGLRPGVLDAFAYYNPVSARLDSVSQAGITTGNFANPELRAERSGELELGFDAGFLHDRASLEVTYYDKKSRDALVSRDLPQSLGGPISQFFNLGSVSNKGLEVSLSATPLQRNDYVLAFTLTGSTTKNKLTKLGDVPPIIFGYEQRHQQGYPLGGYWGTTVDSFTVQPDGSINPEEVYFTTDPDKYRFLGNSLPTKQASFSGDLTLFKFLRISTMFEYRGGNKMYNSTEQFRCLSFVGTCRGLNDKNAPAQERANAFANYMSGGAFFGGYIEDASFVKWRELSFTFNAPASLASRVRSSGLSLTLAGRNLGTWTKYTGLDPEVNVVGQDNFTQGDFLTQPQVRYLIARLNVAF